MENWRQVSGIAGIAFVILFVVGGFISGEVPTYADGGDEIAAWFADNGDTYLLGDLLTGLAFIFFYFPFLVGLYGVLRAAEGEPAFWSRIALAAGIVFPIAGLVGGVPLSALAMVEGDVSADLAAMASATSYHAFAAVGAISAVLMGAASVAILKSRAFWTWLGWLGAVPAVLAIIGSASSLEKDPEGLLAIVGILAFMGLGVWILAVSAALLRAKGQSRVE